MKGCLTEYDKMCTILQREKMTKTIKKE